MQRKKSWTILFDFDNTLYATEKIKFALRSLLLSLGFSEVEADEIYLEAREKDGIITICRESFVVATQRHLSEKNLGYKNKLVDQVIKQILQGDNNVVGAVDLLTFCQAKKLPMYLLSLGITKWQKEKVIVSGLKKFFLKENIIFTKKIETGKIEVIKKIFIKNFTGKNTIIFNDKPDETANILRTFPDLIAFVRYETMDKRYSKKDFIELKKEFGKRVAINKSLVVLKNKLAKVIDVTRI